MKLGVLQFFSWPERRTALETVFARALERIEIMDRSGFDAVWLAEMHGAPERSVLSAPMMVASAIAAATDRVRIGIEVTLVRASALSQDQRRPGDPPPLRRAAGAGHCLDHDHRDRAKIDPDRLRDDAD